MTTLAIEILKELKYSTDRTDKLFYLSYMREVGKLGKRLYAINPNEPLKKFLMNLSTELLELAKELKVE